MNYPEQFLSSQIQVSEFKKKKKGEKQNHKLHRNSLSGVAYTIKLFRNKFCI